LFGNEFVVVSISSAVGEMASTLSNFLKSTLSGQYNLPNVGIYAKTLYLNMATFSLTGQTLQQDITMGINPDLGISPGYIRFQDDDVKKYGYFLLFVMTPIYANAIWHPNTADCRALLPQKEQKIIIEQEKEDEDNKSYYDTELDDPVNDGFEAKESNTKQTAYYTFRRVLDYITATSQYTSFPLVYFKTTNKMLKKGGIINKNESPVFDALELDGSGIKMEDFPIHPTPKYCRNMAKSLSR
jgi:hypothetical protein